MHELVIKNGRVMDPASRSEGRYNIGVKDGRIVTLTSDDVKGAIEIDARGMVVSPGFVDVHTHADGNVLAGQNQACIGVTTAIGGNCGSVGNLDAETDTASIADRMEDVQELWQSKEDFPSILDRVDREGYPIHLAMQVGNGYLRQKVGLADKAAPADDAAIQKMAGLAEAAMEAGAFGVSFGLAYCPGTSPDELTALSAVAARHGGLISSHPRGNGPGFPGALPSGIEAHQELIDIGRRVGVRVVLSHIAHQLAFPSRPYAAIVELGLEQIDRARREGVDVTADTLPVDVFGAIVSQPFLDMALTPALEKVFGATLEDALEIAEGPHKGEKMTAELFLQLRREAPNTSLTGHLMREDLMIRTLLPSYVMVSNDSSVGSIDPMQPMVLGKMVREKKVLTLMEALGKMTILPAECFGLHRKGRIAVGADADFVIFDPKTIDSGDTSGDLPRTPGIEHVIVGGVSVIDGGTLRKDARPGKMLRHQDWA